jgi:hypothetical protein
MQTAVLFAPGDEDQATRAADAFGPGAFCAPLASALVFGPAVVVFVVWSARAARCVERIRGLLSDHGALVIGRMDEEPLPDDLAPFAVAADSPRAVQSALRLSFMQKTRRTEEGGRPRVRPRRIGALAAGATALALIVAASAAAIAPDRTPSAHVR